MEKHFMDYYLIDDVSQQMQYASLDRIYDLNAFEQCLLIDTCIRTNQQVDFAKQFVELAKLKHASSSNQEFDNRVFDLVLNLNQLDSMKGQFDKLK